MGFEDSNEINVLVKRGKGGGAGGGEGEKRGKGERRRVEEKVRSL